MIICHLWSWGEKNENQKSCIIVNLKGKQHQHAQRPKIAIGHMYGDP